MLEMVELCFGMVQFSFPFLYQYLQQVVYQVLDATRMLTVNNMAHLTINRLHLKQL
jgi:hypothetical protein